MIKRLAEVVTLKPEPEVTLDDRGPGSRPISASLEQEFEAAKQRLQEVEHAARALRERGGEIGRSIGAEEASQAELKRQLASGANVEVEVEASERKVLGFKRLRDGVASLLAREETACKSALAEVQRLAADVALQNRRAEHDRKAEDLTLEVKRVVTGVDQISDAILQVRRLANELEGMRDVAADANEARLLAGPAREAFRKLTG